MFYYALGKLIKHLNVVTDVFILLAWVDKVHAKSFLFVDLRAFVYMRTHPLPQLKKMYRKYDSRRFLDWIFLFRFLRETGQDCEQPLFSSKIVQPRTMPKRGNSPATSLVSLLLLRGNRPCRSRSIIPKDQIFSLKNTII